MIGGHSSSSPSALGEPTDSMPGVLTESLEQLQQDLELARALQQAMLPLQYPTLPRGAAPHESALLFHHNYRSNSLIGGDFLSIFPISETAAGVFLCDVMGHGVRAALVSAMVSALLEEAKPLATDPGALLTEINRSLSEILERAHTLVFTSAFYLVADVASGTLRFANAGHPSPLHAHGALCRAGREALNGEARNGQANEPAQITELLGAHGPALGMMPEAHYPTCETCIAEGDLLLLFTDGIYEAAREDGEMFGIDRVFSTVRQQLEDAPNTSLPMLCDVLLEAGAQFAGGFEDDLCIVALEVARLGVPTEAGRDRLTGLFNENYLRESLEREVHRAGRQGYHVGIIAMEIDGLETYSAQHGQHAADDILREFGSLLNRHTRRSDIACRPRNFGFTLVLPEASLSSTERKANQLCEVLKSQFHQLFDRGELSLNLGLAAFPQHGATGEAIVQAATEAMRKN